MITDKLTIFGDREDVTNICDLLSKCIQNVKVDVTLAVLYTKDITEFKNYGEETCVILPYEFKDKISCKGKAVTYSLKESAADVSSLNLQKRENSLCFEVLCGASMSRVFIPYTSSFTQKQVLVCASVLCAWGVSADKAVSAINEILRETHS